MYTFGGAWALSSLGRDVYLEEVASLRPEVYADARLGSTEAEAATARVIAYQAHGAVLGRTARERRIHLVANFRDPAVAHEFVDSRLVLHREGRAMMPARSEKMWPLQCFCNVRERRARKLKGHRARRNDDAGQCTCFLKKTGLFERGGRFRL